MCGRILENYGHMLSALNLFLTELPRLCSLCPRSVLTFWAPAPLKAHGSFIGPAAGITKMANRRAADQTFQGSALVCPPSGSKSADGTAPQSSGTAIRRLTQT